MVAGRVAFSGVEPGDLGRFDLSAPPEKLSAPGGFFRDDSFEDIEALGESLPLGNSSSSSSCPVALAGVPVEYVRMSF